MQQLRTLLIINPIAGTRSKRGLAKAICKRVEAMGHSIDTAYTDGPGAATTLSRNAAAEGYDAVLVCGGDGTVNEAARGLIGTQTPMVILPNGSGNGLARHMTIPAEPLQALSVLHKGYIADCDYCTANGHPFFCTFGIGFDAAVSYRFAKSGKRGLATYLKSAVDEFIHYTPQKLSININGMSHEVNAFLMTCCNASQYGNNAFIAPTASITDGLLDVTLVHSGNPLSQLFVGVEMIAGLITKGGLIDTFRTQSVIVERTQEGAVHLDGEPVEMGSHIKIECHHAGLKIYAPSGKSKFRPLISPLLMTFNDMKVRLTGLMQSR